jgi:hypothetical protein
MKTCTKCQIEKNVDEFSLRNIAKNILCNICKECMNKYAQEYRNNNREKIKESFKKYYNETGKIKKKNMKK